MKTFYTVRDIEDMHAAGVVEIETDDDVVVTDVAREKAIALGMRLIPAEEAADRRREPDIHRTAAAPTKPGPASGELPKPPVSPSESPASMQTRTRAADAELVMKIKTAVIARLGTDKYNTLLDEIIPRVISQLKK